MGLSVLWRNYGTLEFNQNAFCRHLIEVMLLQFFQNIERNGIYNENVAENPDSVFAFLPNGWYVKWQSKSL